MRRLSSCCGAARWVLLLAGSLPPWSRPAYAEDQVSETVLTVAGTPEPDGSPVRLDVTVMTTDPARAPAGRGAGPRLRRHQGRRGGDRPDPGPGRVRGDHLHRPRVRRLGWADPPEPSGLRGRGRAADRRPGRRAARGAQGRRRPGGRVRRGLVRRRAGPAGRRPGQAGGRDRAGVHLEPAGPGPVPAVPGCRRRRVPGRRDAGRRHRGVQAGLGVAAVQQRRAVAGRRRGGR